MNLEQVSAPEAMANPYEREAEKLLVEMERLIREEIDDETALLYSGEMADPYEMSRIKETPTSWYSNEEGVKKLQAGVALLKEIIAIQDDSSLSQEQKVQQLQPKVTLLREEYGI